MCLLLVARLPIRSKGFPATGRRGAGTSFSRLSRAVEDLTHQPLLETPRLRRLEGTGRGERTVRGLNGVMGGGQGGRSHAPQRLLRSRHLITCVWAYQACAEPGDKLLGPHSWEGALGRADAEASNFCSWLRPCDSSLIVCTLQFDKLL